VQDQRVAVRVVEERHVADARVALADELDALRFELGARGGDVLDPERDPVRRARRELDALVLRLPQRERDVPSLELSGLARVLRQLEHVAVERDRPFDVPRRDVHEINSFDPQCRER
jgi:hypothetical protein